MSSPHGNDIDSDDDEALILAETIKQSRLGHADPSPDNDDALKAALAASSAEFEKTAKDQEAAMLEAALAESRKDKAYAERLRYRALAAGLRQSKASGASVNPENVAAVAGIPPVPAEASGGPVGGGLDAVKGKAASVGDESEEEDDGLESEEEDDDGPAPPVGRAQAAHGQDEDDDDDEDYDHSDDEEEDGPRGQGVPPFRR